MSLNKQHRPNCLFYILVCLFLGACSLLPIITPAPMTVFQTSGLEAEKVLVETLPLSEKIPFPSGLAFHPIRKTLFVTSQDRDQRWVYEVETQTGKVIKWKSGGAIISPTSPCPQGVGNTTGQCELQAALLQTTLGDYPAVVIDSQAQIYLLFSYFNQGLFTLVEEGRGQIQQIKLVAPEQGETPIIKLFPTTNESYFKDNPKKLLRPRGMSIDQNGTIYLVDAGNQMIRKIEQGMISNIAGSTQEGYDYLPSTGYKDGNNNAAGFFSPYNLAVNSLGEIFVTDRLIARVRKISLNGDVSTFAGPTFSEDKNIIVGTGFSDGVGDTARFQQITGIVIDKQDNLYVSDTGNQAIRKISPSGVVTTLAGFPLSLSKPKQVSSQPMQPIYFINGPGSEARFHSPIGLALDDQGVLYVADRGNQAIRRIKPIGEQKQ